MSRSGFQRWLDETTQEAMRQSSVLDTRMGPVQYTDIGPLGQARMLGSEGKGPVVLRSHGSPVGCDIGLSMFDHLTKAGIRVITPSRPGFFQTPLSAGARIEAQAELFVAFMDALGLERVVLHAWSGGGPPGLIFAQRFPQRCAGYIHYCAVAHQWKHRITWFEKALLADRTLYLIHKLAARFPETFRRKSAAELGVDYSAIRDNPQELEQLDQFFKMIAPPSLRNPGSFNDIENYRQLGEIPFSEIRIPILVVFSRNDPQLPFSHGELLASKVPGAQFLKLETGGHIPHIGPEGALVIKSVVDFIRQSWRR